MYIKANQLWEHKNKHTYRVLYIANEFADQEQASEYPIMVIYTRYDESDGKIWAKSPDGFLRSRTLIGDLWHAYLKILKKY